MITWTSAKDLGQNRFTYIDPSPDPKILMSDQYRSYYGFNRLYETVKGNFVKKNKNNACAITLTLLLTHHI